MVDLASASLKAPNFKYGSANMTKHLRPPATTYPLPHSMALLEPQPTEDVLSPTLYYLNTLKANRDLQRFFPPSIDGADLLERNRNRIKELDATMPAVYMRSETWRVLRAVQSKRMRGVGYWVALLLLSHSKLSPEPEDKGGKFSFCSDPGLQKAIYATQYCALFLGVVCGFWTAQKLSRALRLQMLLLRLPDRRTDCLRDLGSTLRVLHEKLLPPPPVLLSPLLEPPSKPVLQPLNEPDDIRKTVAEVTALSTRLEKLLAEAQKLRQQALDPGRMSVLDQFLYLFMFLFVLLVLFYVPISAVCWAHSSALWWLIPTLLPGVFMYGLAAANLSDRSPVNGYIIGFLKEIDEKSR